jgi:signal transduction histidine kinase
VDMDATVVDEEHLTVKGNERLLKAAFSNLIHNSLQYSNNGQSSIALTSKDDGLQIRIENRGATIGKNERQFLFRHFFRGENSQGTRGFGLGLVLIDKVIQLHRGRVTYQSDEETNMFIVTLPLRQSLSSLSQS